MKFTLDKMATRDISYFIPQITVVIQIYSRILKKVEKSSQKALTVTFKIIEYNSQTTKGSLYIFARILVADLLTEMPFLQDGT